MNRREALSAVTFLFGGTIIGAEAFLSGCTNKAEATSGLLTDDDILLLNEIAETILPSTQGSPGAKEANVGEFMKTIISDCYSEKEKKIFIDGLIKFKHDFGEEFAASGEEKKRDFLLSLESEVKEYTASNSVDTHYYSMIKQLTVWGFLSSETGATKALRHVAIPGRYEGCIPLQPGEKAWG